MRAGAKVSPGLPISAIQQRATGAVALLVSCTAAATISSPKSSRSHRIEPAVAGGIETRSPKPCPVSGGALLREQALVSEELTVAHAVTGSNSQAVTGQDHFRFTPDNGLSGWVRHV